MKNYLIIGASSGIGKQLAQQLSLNHSVWGTYYQHAEDSSSKNLKLHYYNCLDDASDLSFVPEQLNGLVFCPGSILLKPFHRIKPAEFSADYQLQVIGAVRAIQAVLPNLKASGDASIVLFSTVAAQVGLNFHSLVAASKGAIEGLTLALAAELAPHIRVNCVAPSLTQTPLAAALLNTEEKINANAQRHPLKKIGTTNDIANMVEFLLSEKAGWISGQVMHVDGGLSKLKI